MLLRFRLIIPILLLACGCNLPGRTTPAGVDTPGTVFHASDAPALDASPRTVQLPALQVFVLELPRGTVSANRELWRRIDEQSVDPGTYDVLWANGVRVGGATNNELSHISGTLGIERAQRMDVMARTPGRQFKELPLTPYLDEVTLFWFDAAKRHHGRTFQRSETVMALAFEPTPGRTQSVRISMTPVVRSVNPRLVVTPSGGDYGVSEVRDTTLFDLRLKADVPIGEFLIVSPSDQMQWETCLGRQFFTIEKEGELFERVYVLIPTIASTRTAE